MMNKFEQHLAELGYEIVDYRHAKAGEYYYYYNANGSLTGDIVVTSTDLEGTAYKYPILRKIKDPIKVGDWCVVWWDDHIKHAALRKIAGLRVGEQLPFIDDYGVYWQHAQLVTEWIEEKERTDKVNEL